MFSASFEMVLAVAFREADSRNHAHVTLEHLLYAICHDPQGEEILEACGADLDGLRAGLQTHLEEQIEQRAEGDAFEPIQTVAFQRVLQTTALHVQSSGKSEAGVGDALAALLQESRSRAAKLLERQGITRLDILNFISHGIAKVPRRMADGPVPVGDGEHEEQRAVEDPLTSYTVDLT
ncbi:MAG: ATP-dependent Clp protease ATP-binding subunit ClpA, partial [bacterium]|nr:ATP-dependent Clp protease ATP-binding subunit ClpA [bacterium]